jgi:hypothetical protein
VGRVEQGEVLRDVGVGEHQRLPPVARLRVAVAAGTIAGASSDGEVQLDAARAWRTSPRWTLR